MIPRLVTKWNAEPLGGAVVWKCADDQPPKVAWWYTGNAWIPTCCEEAKEREYGNVYAIVRGWLLNAETPVTHCPWCGYALPFGTNATASAAPPSETSAP